MTDPQAAAERARPLRAFSRIEYPPTPEEWYGDQALVRGLARDVLALAAALHREQQETETLREELMRCGLLAVSERADGCISRTTALRIREIAHHACWPNAGAAAPAAEQGQT